MSRAAHLESVAALRSATEDVDKVATVLRLDAVTSAITLAAAALGEYPTNPHAALVMAELHAGDEFLRDAVNAFERARFAIDTYTAAI